MLPSETQNFAQTDVLAAARTGDADAFELLFRTYRTRVYRIARQYFAPRIGLEDLFQEATIGFYKAVRDFKDDRGSFPAFAELCVRRQVITFIKSSTRQKHNPLNYAASLDAPIFDGSDEPFIERIRIRNPDSFEDDSEVLEFLEALWVRCSELERGVLTMYSRGFSFEDMALELGVHLKSIDNAVWRVKVKARKLADEARF